MAQSANRQSRNFNSFIKIYIYKDFINRTCQWVSVLNATHILQCARAHDYFGYHCRNVELIFIAQSIGKVRKDKDNVLMGFRFLIQGKRDFSNLF